jgi:hypothetical protein
MVNEAAVKTPLDAPLNCRSRENVRERGSAPTWSRQRGKSCRFYFDPSYLKRDLMVQNLSSRWHKFLFNLFSFDALQSQLTLHCEN